MSDNIRIRVSKTSDGFVFRIDPRCLYLLGEGTHTQRPDKVFISFESQYNTSSLNGFFLKQTASLLTGLSDEKMREIGNVVFVDALTDKVLEA